MREVKEEIRRISAIKGDEARMAAYREFIREEYEETVRIHANTMIQDKDGKMHPLPLLPRMSFLDDGNVVN